MKKTEQHFFASSHMFWVQTQSESEACKKIEQRHRDSGSKSFAYSVYLVPQAIGRGIKLNGKLPDVADTKFCVYREFDDGKLLTTTRESWAPSWLPAAAIEEIQSVEVALAREAADS